MFRKHVIQIKTTHHTFLCYTLSDNPPQGIGIPPIFNVVDLKLYKGDNNNIDSYENNKEDTKVDWIKDLPLKKSLKLEYILDTKTIKKTRNKTCKEYLVKWQGFPEVEATWMTKEDIINMAQTFSS